jgi:hypothetical protein
MTIREIPSYQLANGGVMATEIYNDKANMMVGMWQQMDKSYTVTVSSVAGQFDALGPFQSYRNALVEFASQVKDCRAKVIALEN